MGSRATASDTDKATPSYANCSRVLPKRICFSQHNVFNPRIEVTGNEAQGIWYFMGPFTFRKDNQELWLAARYEDDYFTIGGQWKFEHLRLLDRMTAPDEAGWAGKTRVKVFE